MLKLVVLSFALLLLSPLASSNPQRIILNNLFQNKSNVGLIKNIGMLTSGLRGLINAKHLVSHMREYWTNRKAAFFEHFKFLGNVADNKCAQDILYSFENLLAGNLWAIQMLDSQGKPPSGLLEGNIRWAGSSHECKKVYAPPKESSKVGNFHGQYCSLELTIHFQNNAVPLTLGFCLPDSCSMDEIESNLKQLMANVTSMLPVLGGYHPPIKVNKRSCHGEPKVFTGPSIAVLTVIVFFVILALIGTFLTAKGYSHSGYLMDNTRFGYSNMQKRGNKFTLLVDEESHADECKKTKSVLSTACTDDYYQDTTEGPWNSVKAFFSCFCLLSNGSKILNTESFEGELLFLHGFRFLSFCWIFICHLYAASASVSGNLLELANSLDNWAGEIILNGFFSVDSFFFLSGFLVAYSYFKETEKTGGKISWAYYYIHRYIRLTPVYMIIIGVYATLPYFLETGPFARSVPVEPTCKSHWLWNLLYINNFLNNWARDSGSFDLRGNMVKCMAWSWYLALDMQYFVICPIFLISLWRWPKIGYSLLGVFIAISFVTNFAITYNYNIISTLHGMKSPISSEVFATRYSDFFNKIYDKPYTRISPYVIGVALAFYISKRKNIQSEMSPVTLFCGWTASTTSVLLCLFCLHDKEESIIVNGFYNGVSHTCYSLSIAWIFYTCLSERHSPVKSFLSWKFFIPLSRLTYSAYLIHVLVISGYFNGVLQPFKSTHMTLVVTFFGLLPMTFAVAFVVSLLFESPILRLEKVVRTKFKTC